jgi:hypothetical protein
MSQCAQRSRKRAGSSAALARTVQEKARRCPSQRSHDARSHNRCAGSLERCPPLSWPCALVSTPTQSEGVPQHRLLPGSRRWERTLDAWSTGASATSPPRVWHAPAAAHGIAHAVLRTPLATGSRALPLVRRVQSLAAEVSLLQTSRAMAANATTGLCMPQALLQRRAPAQQGASTPRMV